jgi:RimJ/RimL family protein N-acetyltransferase
MTAIVGMSLEQKTDVVQRHSVAATRRLKGEHILYGEAYVIQTGKQCELSYWVSEGMQKHGVATTLVQTLCRYVFGKKKLHAHRIDAFVSPANPFAAASIRVLEKNGFTEDQSYSERSRRVRGEGYQCFSLLKEHWAKNEPVGSPLVSYSAAPATSVPPESGTKL